MKSRKYEEVLQEELQHEEFRREYEALEEEFTLAEEVIELRKHRNLTQRELAERTGTSQPAIARLESGNYKNLTLSFLRRIAKALNAVPEVHLRRQRGT